MSDLEFAGRRVTFGASGELGARSKTLCWVHGEALARVLSMPA